MTGIEPAATGFVVPRSTYELVGSVRAGVPKLRNRRMRPSEEATIFDRSVICCLVHLGYTPVSRGGWIRTNMFACRASSAGRNSEEGGRVELPVPPKQHARVQAALTYLCTNPSTAKRRERESNPRSCKAHSFSKRAPGTDAGRPLQIAEEGVGVEPNSRSYAPASNGAASPLAFTFHAEESGGHDPHA